MSPIASIAIGVFTGVLTAAMLFVLKVNFYKLLLPWFRKRSYDGIELAGSWRVDLTPPHKNRTIKIELKQEASSLKGLAIHAARNEDVSGDEIRAYNLKGRIHDRFVSLTGDLTDPKRLGALHYLLELSADGQVMHGYVMAYSTHENKIVVHDCTLMRMEATESLERRTRGQLTSSSAQPLSSLTTS